MSKQREKKKKKKMREGARASCAARMHTFAVDHLPFILLELMAKIESFTAAVVFYCQTVPVAIFEGRYDLGNSNCSNFRLCTSSFSSSTVTVVSARPSDEKCERERDIQTVCLIDL